MRGRLVIAMGLACGVLLMPAWDAPAQAGSAQGKSQSPKEQRVDGTVRMMDKAAKTITVRVRGRVNERVVVYNDKTEFTFRNKKGALEDVADGRRVIVLGTPNDKNQLVARRIDIRDKS
jgi:hypothetical protein